MILTDDSDLIIAVDRLIPDREREAAVTLQVNRPHKIILSNEFNIHILPSRISWRPDEHIQDR